mgnify:FL=1
MSLIIFILCLFFPSKILAATTVSILDFPAKVLVGETFPITFNVTASDIGTTFHYKAVSNNSDISIFPACANRYNDCQNLIIGENFLATASAYLKINQAQPQNSIKIRIANHFKHQQSFDSNPVDIISLALPSISPTPEISIIPTPTLFESQYPYITEIMPNPEDGSEWVEFYNPYEQNIPLKNLCIFDSSQHKKCLSVDIDLAPHQYYQFTFSASFLINSGDSVHFNQETISYSKAPKNLSYSLQSDGSWCFAPPSPGFGNFSCQDLSVESSELPPVDIIFIPDKIRAGEDFNITLSLRSADLYSIRLVHPFSSPYFAFNNYQNDFATVNLSLSASQKLPEGRYPLLFHLKKAGSSKIYDYQQGTLEVLPFIKKVKSKKTTTTKTKSAPLCSISTPAVLGTQSAIVRQAVFTPGSPDFNTFSWLFLAAGSILFLSPILFPKLYSD